MQNIRKTLLSRLPRQFKKRKSDITFTGSNDTLPTELWLEILSYLPIESIDALSLTCRALNEISQPLFFRRQILMHPFASSITYRGLELKSYMARSMERLDFLTSPRIACHVQEISLTPYPRGHSLSRSGAPHVPENDIVDRIFDVLPLFPNLKTLIIHSIKSTPRRMDILQTLCLQVFELETRGDDRTWLMNMQEDEPLLTPIMARRSFSFNCDAGPHQSPLPILIPLKFMYSELIKEITSGPNGTESILAAISLSPSPFVQLALLDISVRFVSHVMFIAALRQCPRLIALRLRSSATDSPAHARPTMIPLPSDVLPRLVSYHGPPSLVPFFSQNRFLRDIKLWSSRSIMSTFKPTHLAPILTQIGTHVASLEIGVTTVPSFLIETMQNHLPNLKSLSINAHLAPYHPGIPTSHITHTSHTPIIDTAVMGGGKYHLDVLCLGVQLPGIHSPEQETAAIEVLDKFPEEYDPTSWGHWAIDSPWSRIIWKRHEDDTGPHNQVRGRMSIENVEYFRPVFKTKE